MIKLGLRQRRDGSNRISLRFPNGSRIVGIPGKEATLRGFSAVSLLIIDEASRVDDAVYKKLCGPCWRWGMGGFCGCLALRSGSGRFFYENWAGGSEDWVRDNGAGYGVLADYGKVSGGGARRQMGDLWFRQEYMCEFIDETCQMFGRDLVMAALDEEEPLRF